MGYIILFI